MRKTNNYNKSVNYNSIGNTGAFLLIKKSLFNEINGFNENYIECFEDVELNLECLLKNKKNITVSDAVAYHHESVSRNRSSDKIKNLQRDYIQLLYPFYLKNINYFSKIFIKK